MADKIFDFSADYKTSDKTQCPHCGKFTDMAMGEKGHKPSEGSISICIGCAEPSVFNADLSLRKLNEAEQGDKDLQEQLAKLTHVVKTARMKIAYEKAGKPPIIPIPGNPPAWSKLWAHHVPMNKW